MNKQQLLNKRDHLRSLIAHLDASRFHTVPDKDFDPLFSIEQLAIIQAEIWHWTDLAEHRLKATGISDWERQGRVSSYLERRRIARNQHKTSTGRIPRLEKKSAELQGQIAWNRQAIIDKFEDMKTAWASLTDDQKAWLEDPHPNPQTALDFPGAGHAALGMWPDERLPLQDRQHFHLSRLLRYVESEIEELEGKA